MPLENISPASPPSQASIPKDDPWGHPSLLGGHSPASQPANYAVINTSSAAPGISPDFPMSQAMPQAMPLPISSNMPRDLSPSDLMTPWDDPAPIASSVILQPQQTNAPINNANASLLSGLNDPFDPFGPTIMSSSPPQIPPHAPIAGSSPNLPSSSKMGTILDNRTKHLVNIDNLISTQTPTSGSTNPFGTPRPSNSVFSGDSTNPFLATSVGQPVLSLNELKNPVDPHDNTNPFC